MTRATKDPARVLGVDFGNVIVCAAVDSEESMFSAGYLLAPPSGNCLAVLALLNGPTRFDGRVHVVSKAGERIERRTREWMARQDFHERTGIAVDKLHFVRRIEDKPDICRQLGVTHFVDDRLAVLELMPWLAGRYLYSPTKPGRLPAGLTWVPSWSHLNSKLTW